MGSWVMRSASACVGLLSALLQCGNLLPGGLSLHPLLPSGSEHLEDSDLPARALSRVDGPGTNAGLPWLFPARFPGVPCR